MVARHAALVLAAGLALGAGKCDNLPELPPGCKVVVGPDGRPDLACPTPAPAASPSVEPSLPPSSPDPSPTAGPIPTPDPCGPDGKRCSPPPPQPSPTAGPASPAPSATPGTPPTPEPTATPGTPSPVPENACSLGTDGNYPVPPVGTCPACWRKDPGLIAYWGVAFRSKTPCSGQSCPYGVKINVDITPHSGKPYLRHRQQSGGGGTDTWEGCQPCDDPSNPECRAAIPEIWVYPPGSEGGLCDPFSGSLYWCHHKPQAGQGGPTKFEVHAPPYRSIIVNVP